MSRKIQTQLQNYRYKIINSSALCREHSQTQLQNSRYMITISSVLCQ